MHRRELHDGWWVSHVAGTAPSEITDIKIPAQVPGSIHLDLLRADLIPDPYLDSNELDLVWLHRTGWRYETTFDAEPAAADERVDLVFEGLDTVSRVELNGRELLRSYNQHRTYRVDAAAALAASSTGQHHLAVTFESALQYAEQIEAQLHPRPHEYPHPFNMVRKMACSFGWDWGPDLQTAGIWRPVRLERWRVARLASVRPTVTVDGDTGNVRVEIDLERAGNEPVSVVASVRKAGETLAEVTVPVGADATTALAQLQVPNVELWWPRGYGEQPLYELTVTVASDEPHDNWQRQIGFRTVQIDNTADADGEAFRFVVNGKPIFAKGANWIPDDHFLTRVDAQQYQRRIDQAAAAGMNMLRIWGGGIYESDDFYDYCDRVGIMVWQDFLLACSSYPEEEPVLGEIIAEARDNIVRLMPHPSLVLWNGGNENLWGYVDWNWQPRLEGRTWGHRYYYEIFPQLIAELDPTRAYIPGSPFSPEPDRHPNDKTTGVCHEWDVWNRVDYTNYRNYVPRFCAEFGFQGPPTMATLTRAISDVPLAPNSPGMLHHQKAGDGAAKLERGFAPHLPQPRNFDDWHFTTQLNQARAIEFALEHYRSHWPYCAGAIVWQLNDCWPVVSWSAIDGDERKKPLWYALRHAFADRLLTWQPRDGATAVVAVNDTDEPWQAELTIRRMDLGGAVLAETRESLTVPARSTATVKCNAELTTAADLAAEVLVVDSADGPRAVHLFAPDRDVRFNHNPFTATAVAITGGYRVDVVAHWFVRDLALLADRLAPDAEVDEMLVNLLPGEQTSFVISTAAELIEAEILDHRVLRSANSLTH